MRIALYDIDYTLIPFDSFGKFVKLLIQKKPVNIFKIPKLALQGILTASKIMTLTEYKSKWLKLTENFTDEQLDLISSQFVKEQIIPRIKPQSIENIEAYRNSGYKIVLATASFEFYLKYLAEYLKADYFFGTQIEIANGHRKILGNNCKGIEKIDRIAKSINADEIEKDTSVGFSDSMSDYPYTKLTGVFNIVHRKKWKINKTYLTSHR